MRILRCPICGNERLERKIVARWKMPGGMNDVELEKVDRYIGAVYYCNKCKIQVWPVEYIEVDKDKED